MRHTRQITAASMAAMALMAGSCQSHRLRHTNLDTRITDSLSTKSHFRIETLTLSDSTNRKSTLAMDNVTLHISIDSMNRRTATLTARRAVAVGETSAKCHTEINAADSSGTRQSHSRTDTRETRQDEPQTRRPAYIMATIALLAGITLLYRRNSRS